MTSSIITTKDFESTLNSSEALKPIENLGHQQTPVDKNSAGTAINSPEASLGKEREEVDTPQKYGNEAGESDKYNSTKPSGHIGTNTSLPAPENTTPVSAELDEGGEEESGEEELDDSEEDDSDDDFPKFEGGEPRGRVVGPVAGTRPRPPVRPK